MVRLEWMCSLGPASVVLCLVRLHVSDPSCPVLRSRPRPGAAGAGGPISGLGPRDKRFLDVGLEAFTEVNDVLGTITGDSGLGPTFNLDSCGVCHAHPAVGGI